MLGLKRSRKCPPEPRRGCQGVNQRWEEKVGTLEAAKAVILQQAQETPGQARGKVACLPWATDLRQDRGYVCESGPPATQLPLPLARRDRVRQARSGGGSIAFCSRGRRETHPPRRGRLLGLGATGPCANTHQWFQCPLRGAMSVHANSQLGPAPGHSRDLGDVGAKCKPQVQFLGHVTSNCLLQFLFSYLSVGFFRRSPRDQHKMTDDAYRAPSVTFMN